MKEIIFYKSYEKPFRMLSNKDGGQLIMALFAYARGEDMSSTLSPTASMAYSFITQQMDIDYMSQNITSALTDEE